MICSDDVFRKSSCNYVRNGCVTGWSAARSTDLCGMSNVPHNVFKRRTCEFGATAKMTDEAADRTQAKRQATSSGRPSQQNITFHITEHRSYAATRTGYSDHCHGDQHGVPPPEDAHLDSQPRDVPDSQEGLADDLAELCTFKSAGTGLCMRINSPSSIAQVLAACIACTRDHAFLPAHNPAIRALEPALPWSSTIALISDLSRSTMGRWMPMDSPLGGV